VGEYSELFVGLDVSKLKISVAVAEAGRGGEVRFYGDISASPQVVAAMMRKLVKPGVKLHFCYEAGPTGYELYRQIVDSGHACTVVAPSLIPKRPGERVKTNRRDALSLAKLHRAGELTAVWVPDRAHEAIRDLVRAREAASSALKVAHQQLQSFLLRHGRIYAGKAPWTKAHSVWLCDQTFDHPAQQIVFAECRHAIEETGVRLDRLTSQVRETVAGWSMAPVVNAYQTMRGVSLIVAVTFAVEIGDVRRFDSPRQLMAYLGLVPSESSTGERVKRGGITKAGNNRARRVLIEGAWTYRFPARMSRTLQARQEGVPKAARDVAWKGQVRLCGRYRKLILAGKQKNVATTAIAREMAAFLWAIGQHVEPRIEPTAAS
jgi:transposase